MNCPHCNIPLMMAERKGVEIDFCSQCRGVWLDKGELDKIIELSVSERAPVSNAAQPAPRESYDYHQQRGYSNHKSHYKYKKKKSLMGELFDIFD